ncbi:MAG: TSCPD domain-containing protein [Intestinibacter sp.]
MPCKSKGSSCPDQLANALKIYREFVYKDER